MKAAFYDRYGYADVVRVRDDLPNPTIKPHEVLVKIVATSVNASDSRIRGARFPKGFAFFARLAFGITRPRKHVLGSCYSGVIESVGKEVSDYKVGDEVCGTTGIAMGTHAEYVSVKASKLVKKPKQLAHEDVAGMIFGGTAALYFLRDKAQVKEGEKVLINGASGAVGTNAVQLANYFGATVEGVTTSENEKLVLSLGAQKVFDYTHEDVLKHKTKYDVVLDSVGNFHIASGSKILTKKGRLVLMVASFGEILRSQLMKNVITGTASEKRDDIAFLVSLMQDGKLRTVIDKVYTLDEISKAHAHVDSGKKTGNVVVRVAA